MGVVIGFVDDSKQTARRAGLGTLIALGAVTFPVEQVKPFADAVNSLLDSKGVPRNVELKWSPDGKRDWFKTNEQTALLTPLRKEVLRLAAHHEARAVAVIWDVTLKPTLQGSPAEGHVIGWMWERLSMMIENRQDLGIVVFDKPGGDHKAEDKWIADTIDLTADGTSYVKANSIVMPFLTAPSHHHRHLQAADLIVGSVTAAIAGSPYGLELVPSLLPLLHRNALGDIGGAGVKLYPTDLNNLLHWALAEDSYSWPSKMKGVTLPWAGFGWFVGDDGLTAT